MMTVISQRPRIKYPLPSALEKIEEFLQENRWRLVDLFASLDKNKDWRVRKEDFVRACRRSELFQLSLSDSVIEELITALSHPNSDFINYKRLARGRSSHLSDKRNQLLQSVESIHMDEFIPAELQQLHKSKSTSLSSSTNKLDRRQESRQTSDRETIPSSNSAKQRFVSHSTDSLSQYSTSPSMNPNYLQLPKIDTRPDHYPLPRTLVNRGTSVTTSRMTLAVAGDSQQSLNNDEVKVNSLFQNELTSEYRRSRKAVKEKDLLTYETCMRRSVIVENSFSEEKSAVLTRNLRKAILLPADREAWQIVDGWRVKTERKKKDKVERAKLREGREKDFNKIHGFL